MVKVWAVCEGKGNTLVLPFSFSLSVCRCVTGTQKLCHIVGCGFVTQLFLIFFFCPWVLLPWTVLLSLCLPQFLYSDNFPKKEAKQGKLNTVPLLYWKSNVCLSSTPFCVNFLLPDADWSGGVFTNCSPASALSDSKQESNVALLNLVFETIVTKGVSTKACLKVGSNVIFLRICGLIHCHL